MTDPLETLIQRAGAGEALAVEERARMRTLLAEYAAFKPVRAPGARPFAGTPFAWLPRPAFALTAALLILVTGSGGLAYAAQGALPGDLLYPVKVDVTEPVVTALTPSGHAQVAWQATIATRRLAEADALAREGRLASSTEAALIGRAADATFKSATEASLEVSSSIATSATTTASTTTSLEVAAHLLNEGHARFRAHDDAGASAAFRAAIQATATSGEGDASLELDTEEAQVATTTSAEATSTEVSSPEHVEDASYATSTSSSVDAAYHAAAASRQGEAHSGDQHEEHGDDDSSHGRLPFGL